MEKLSPRDRIVATALRLFNASGPHTVGIDQIIAESGVAKRTFYHHFSSKAALLAEFYRRRDDIAYARLVRHTSDPAKAPRERVLALFDALKEWFSEPDFYGCSFIRGLADFGADCGEPEVVASIQAHFARLGALADSLLREARPRDHAAFVPRIVSLMCGAIVVAQATRDPGIADVNRETARYLLAMPE